MADDEVGRALTSAAPDGTAAISIDAIVSHHLNPFRSGVARFNLILAERLGIPCTNVIDERVLEFACPMLSFKVGELGPEEVSVVERLLAQGRRVRVFLHDYADTDLERRLVRQADVVYCGNDEIRARTERLAERSQTLWAPGLILDTRRFRPTEISVFSFGMAHKIQVPLFSRLRDLLDRTGRSHSIYISNANHETVAIEDAELVYEQMRRIFPEGLYFTGNLSDVSVYNWLLNATMFAAFFPRGARANNTSIASAMEHGAAVITNLDDHSPPRLRHLENVIDINQCEELPTDPELLDRIREGAREVAGAMSWDALVDEIREG